MKKINTLKILVLLFASFLVLNLNSVNNLIAESQIENPIDFSSSSIQIESDQDFIDLDFPGSGTESDPYVIENYQIVGDGINSGIEISNTTKHFLIKNCTIKYGLNGMFIEDVAPGTAQILENNITKNGKMGIWIESTIEAHIAKNEFIENFITGIRLENCSGCTIEENICKDHTGDGILFANSEALLITKNIFIDNVNYGIKSWVSSENTICYNYIADQKDFGVYLDGKSDNNSVHHNDFCDNFLRGDRISQGCSLGENNIWYDTELSEGNYWNDYIGKGEYSIAGEEHCCDPFPLGEVVSGLVPEESEETSFLSITGLLILLGLVSIAVYRKRM
ncbi:MAG: hypothetical protein HGN29_08465 [Asgard group archaeon]|nr:hypothetical protein [Asgard group archaeon]